MLDVTFVHMHTGFFSSLRATDQEYRLLKTADWSPAAEVRAFLEGIWPSVAPYLDSALPEKAAHHFRSHFWEVYLAATLVKHGVKLVPRAARGGSDAGPDLLLQDGVGVEATVARAGDGPDAVADPPIGEASWVPDDKIRLRLLNGA